MMSSFDDMIVFVEGAYKNLDAQRMVLLGWNGICVGWKEERGTYFGGMVRVWGISWVALGSWP